MDTNKIEDELMSVTHTARALDVCEQTVRKLADRGVLPVARLAGGQRVFRRTDVEAYAERRRAQAA